MDVTGVLPLGSETGLEFEASLGYMYQKKLYIKKKAEHSRSCLVGLAKQVLY
jgi:hypothetical protein